MGGRRSGVLGQVAGSSVHKTRTAKPLHTATKGLIQTLLLDMLVTLSIPQLGVARFRRPHKQPKNHLIPVKTPFLSGPTLVMPG